MDARGGVARVAALLTAPNTMWEEVAGAPVAARRLFTRLILPFAIAGALAVTGGTAFLNRDWSQTFGYSTSARQAAGIGAATLFLLALMPFVLAWVFQRLGGMYGSSRSYQAALNVAAHGTVPIWVAGCLMFFAPMFIVAMAAFGYSCMLYAGGARIVLDVKPIDSAEFVGIALLFSSLIMSVIGMLAGAAGMI